MNNSVSSEVIGHRIDAFTVLGRENDGLGRWVGADINLKIPPIGSFFLNIVTKQHYVNENLAEALQEADSPEGLLDVDTDPGVESRDPFVLNDDVLTDEVLHRKFNHRVVEEDLAKSLWYLGPVEA